MLATACGVVLVLALGARSPLHPPPRPPTPLDVQFSVSAWVRRLLATPVAPGGASPPLRAPPSPPAGGPLADDEPTASRMRPAGVDGRHL